MTDFLQLAASLKECGNSWGKRYHREKQPQLALSSFCDWWAGGA